MSTKLFSSIVTNTRFFFPRFPFLLHHFYTHLTKHAVLHCALPHRLISLVLTMPFLPMQKCWNFYCLFQHSCYIHLILDSDIKIYLNCKQILCCPSQIQKHYLHSHFTLFTYLESQNEKHLFSDSFGQTQYFHKILWQIKPKEHTRMHWSPQFLQSCLHHVQTKSIWNIYNQCRLLQYCWPVTGSSVSLQRCIPNPVFLGRSGTENRLLPVNPNQLN